jgi:hypothetical protein
VSNRIQDPIKRRVPQPPPNSTYISIAIGVEVGAFALLFVGNPLSDVELTVVVIETAEPVFHVVAPLAFITVTIRKLISALAMSFLIDDFSLVLVVIGVLDVLGHLLSDLFLVRAFPERE